MKKNVHDKDTQLVRIGEKPIKLTKYEYLQRNCTRRAYKPNWNVLGGTWTPDGKDRKVTTIFSDLKSPINQSNLSEFNSWYAQGLVRGNQ